MILQFKRHANYYLKDNYIFLNSIGNQFFKWKWIKSWRNGHKSFDPQTKYLLIDIKIHSITESKKVKLKVGCLISFRSQFSHLVENETANKREISGTHGLFA